MSGYTYLLIGGILGAIGTILVTVGLNTLKRSEEAFSLSIPPSLEITVEDSKAQVPNRRFQDVVIENTGQHRLINIEVYYVEYIYQDGETAKLLKRIQGREPSKLVDPIEPKAKYSFSTKGIQDVDVNYTGNTDPYAAAVVVICRREADNKRFVQIEPFFLSKDDKDKVLSPLYGDRGSFSAGAPSFFTSLARDIIETEKVIFRAQ